MTWLERIRRPASDPRSNQDTEDPGPRERSSPGLAKLFDLLRDDGSHSLLDLGSAGGRQLRLYGRYARQVRFAGMLPYETGADGARDDERLPDNPHAPYDVVLAWDLLDRLAPDERGVFMQRLAAVTAVGARMYNLVDASVPSAKPAVRYAITEIGRVSEEPVGPPVATGPRLLPAEVERVLHPFRVLHAFSLRSGFREYVSEKGR